MSAVQEQKQKTVTQVAKLLKDYPIVGIVNMENLPAAQLQKMRGKLKGKVVLLMTKKTLMRKAIEQSKGKEGVEKLLDFIDGMPALLFTNENPFSVSKIIRKSKSKAPAKPGQKAPFDIVIPAGPTQFAPGPIISDLGSIGLKTGVEGGKVAVKQDSTVAREGDIISAKLASVLGKLGVEPMEIGLDLVVVLENGLLYKRDVLSVDESEYIDNLKLAASYAINLSVYVGFITKDNVDALIKKAYISAKHISELTEKPVESKPESENDKKESQTTEQ